MGIVPMNYRTRYRVSSVPFFVVTISLFAVLALLIRPQFGAWLNEQFPALNYVVLGVGILLPLVFSFWYFSSYAQVRRGWFTVRSMFGKQHVHLKELAFAEVYPKARSHRKGKAFELILRLEDVDGRQVWLPLNAWRDEDLLMARLLRATVECRVPIGGEPLLVKRFSGLLDSYKSWDRQQAVAA